jgi:hypothetical protein
MPVASANRQWVKMGGLRNMGEHSLDKTKTTIEDLMSYIQERGGDYSAWHVGICRTAENVILNIRKARARYWNYVEVDSPQTAREVFHHFVNELGVDRDSVDADAGIVYVYRKQAHTVQQ